MATAQVESAVDVTLAGIRRSTIPTKTPQKPHKNPTKTPQKPHKNPTKTPQGSEKWCKTVKTVEH